MNIYPKSVSCWNCEYDNLFEILLGVEVDDYLDDNACKNCGCHCRLKKKFVNVGVSE